jgi:citrate lyase subunit beta / citryl-CoA lyase
MEIRSGHRPSRFLDALAIKDAEVSIRDEGALPFVIAARIEAAARAAGFAQHSRCLPSNPALPEASFRNRLRRSRLYIPGCEPKYFVNAALHGGGCCHSRP